MAQIILITDKTIVNICAEIHKLFHNAYRHSFPFDAASIPKNGIYVLFERGEEGHGADRIVRIGTHTGLNQLPSRLREHFEKENKDRSIFRKNIGRAILNRAKDPFLKRWESGLIPTSKRKAQVEHEVSDYIRKCFSFVVFEVSDRERRLELESRLIATVSLCMSCGPSATWLGVHSTKQKIRDSGLWLVNHLYKSPLREEDLGFVRKMLNKPK